MTPRCTLHAISDMDPDGHGWRATSPTAVDYAAFENFVIGSYGRDAWVEYRSGWRRSDADL